jgi:tetratricopeptide (TPR) repeat protein
MHKWYLPIAMGILVVLVGCQGTAELQSIDEIVQSGRAYLESGEYDKAISELEGAIERAGDDSDAHFLLGQAYNQDGQLEKAADEFRKVLELNPESAAAHHNLGVTYYQLQDLQSAIDEFESALEIDADDPDTHYQLGATYLTLAISGSASTTAVDPDLLAEATKEFNTALELREGMPEALIGLGNVSMQLGDYENAIDTLQQAIESVPDSREAYYGLASAYAQSGNIDRACETYKHFLSLDPPAGWRAQAEQAMAALACD